jgi:hypothetical protein
MNENENETFAFWSEPTELCVFLCVCQIFNYDRGDSSTCSCMWVGLLTVSARKKNKKKSSTAWLVF